MPAAAGIHVEQPLPDDAQSIAQIHVASWQAAYAHILSAEYLAALSVDKRTALWCEAIEKQSPEVLVAKLDGRIVGWISFGPSRDKGAAADAGELWALYVDPLHWSGGAGRRLWEGARERLVERGFVSVSLWVLTQNARGIGFYENSGFTPDFGSEKAFDLGGRQVQEIRYSAKLSARAD